MKMAGEAQFIFFSLVMFTFEQKMNYYLALNQERDLQLCSLYAHKLRMGYGICFGGHGHLFILEKHSNSQVRIVGVEVGTRGY